jgi:hypothetical protein
VPFLEAFVEGTEPTEPCSEAEHLRVSLPYYLQRFEISRDLALRIDAETVVRLVREGSGDLELSEDGQELILHEEEGVRRVRLDMRRGERRDARDLLAAGTGGGADPAAPPDAGETPVGLDGRPATIIPIKPD